MNRYNIFAGIEFSQFSQGALDGLQKEVYATEPSYLLGVDRAEYERYLVDTHSLDAPTFHFDSLSVDSAREELIPAERFPPTSSVSRGRKYPKDVYRYHLPYSGDERLLRAIPNPSLMMTEWVNIGPGEVSFDIIDFYGDAQRIKDAADSIVNKLRQQAQNLSANVEEHNRAVPEQARYWFGRRKAELTQKNKVLSGLGVPIRKRDNIPETFAVPVVRRKIYIKPEVPSPLVAPEPTLPEPVYQEILQVIHDTGRQFERMPSTYLGKNEETLRDHFLLVLEPRFELSATGETFNKAGKTDILIRFEKRNVFVGECKFWRGAKAHAETIDQLFSYLTWRDSKTAIIYFMDTKEMIAPLRSIEESTSQHHCFVRANGKREESWFDYDFHLPGDESRTLSLSVLCFHFPP